MALYDEIYERYGRNFPLTPADEHELEGAREERKELQEDPGMKPQGDGFVNEEGEFTLDPEIKEYIRIATRTAEQQFFDLPPMPEDVDTAIRFPGIDPEWHASIIDMKFAQREAVAKATLETRAPEVREYTQSLLDRFTQNLPENDGFIRTGMDMLEAAQKHKITTRASKLCHKAEGRRILHERSRKLETSEAVAKYDLMVQGLEYAAGVRTGPVPEEVTTFYRDTLKTELDLDMVKKAELAHSTAQMKVEFEDLDHKLLHQVQANPHNWGKPIQELEAIAEAMDAGAISEAITPYARATADRSITPAFALQEKATDGMINRGDLIIIDGKTIREKMYEDYIASGQEPVGFDRFYAKNIQTAANEYVAAGLMAGKRVEAFVPDMRGRIPDEPTQITKAGYEPSPLKPEKFNAWERFFARRGLYKEKVARQQEYERMMAARERVKVANTANQWEMDGGSVPQVKQGFIGGWLADHGGELGFKSPFSVDRTALHSFAVSRMLMEGYSLEDIADPNALRSEKDAVGRDVCQHLKDGDMKWAGETLFHGLRMLGEEIDSRTAGLDLADESQMLSPNQRLVAFAARVGFDICQESERTCCKGECIATATAYAQSKGIPGPGEDYFWTLHSGVNGAAAYFNYAGRVLNDRPMIAGTLASRADRLTAMGDMVRFEATRRSFGKARAAAPEKGMCSYFPTVESTTPFYAAEAMVGNDPSYVAFQDRMEDDPQFARAVGKELMAGRLQDRLKINVSLDPRTPSTFGVEPPKDKSELEVRTPEQIAAQKQAAKQHKQPQMGGPRR